MLPAFGNPHELTDIEEPLVDSPDDVSPIEWRGKC